jgi:ankyrin repeat protein
MKNLGKFLLAAAAILAFYALFVFDPSVEVANYPGVPRVVNIHKLSFQNNLLLLAGAMGIVGALLAVLAPPPLAQPWEAPSPQFSNREDGHEYDLEFGDAIRTNDFATIKRLLANKAVSPYGRNIHGRGWLQIATLSKQLECCKLLVEHGASPDDKDDLGQTAFAIATRENANEFINLFSSSRKS